MKWYYARYLKMLMDPRDVLQLGDLIDLSGLEKPANLTLQMSPKAMAASEPFSKIAGKIENGEDVRIDEVRDLVQNFASALKLNGTLYYQNEQVGEEDLEIYKQVLAGNLSGGESVQVLPPIIARAMLDKWDLVFHNVRELSVGSAAVLGGHRDRLRLCLSKISPAVARELAKTNVLFLHSGRHKGLETKEEDKYGLESISPEVAQELAASTKGVHLEMLSIDETVARELAKCPSSLYLPLIEDISVGVAGELINHREDLGLGTLEKTSEEALMILAGYQGQALSMRRKDISDRVTEKLAKFEGALYLGGEYDSLKMSEKAVIALAKRKGDLVLAIDKLTVDMAKALAEHQGELMFPGMINLSKEVAEYLAKHELVIGFMHLSRRSYARLAKYNKNYDPDNE